MTTRPLLTDAQIEEIAVEAWHNDWPATERLCSRALDGDADARDQLAADHCCQHCGCYDPFDARALHCRACWDVRTEVARDAERAAGWDPSP